MSNSIRQNTEKDSKGELITLHEMMHNAHDCISLLQNAFIYHNVTLLKEYRGKIKAIKGEETRFTRDAGEVHADNAERNPYVSIPAHILKIAENIDKLSGCIEKKIDGHILFSDKAVREATFLLQRLIEILAPTADIILARNTFLSMYVQESQIGVEKMALDYATLHEERLIKGVCTDAASVIYIGMLDAIKTIAWHSKEIAVKLAGK